LTCSLDAHSPLSKEISKHGDHLKDIAFIVDDVQLATESAVCHGAEVILPVQQIHNERGIFCFSQIGVFGSVVHTLIEADRKDAFYFENFTSAEPLFIGQSNSNDGLFLSIDHVAACVPSDELMRLSEFYIKAFGFFESHAEEVNSGKSGMRSRVVESPCSNVKLVFTAPLEHIQKSQIQDYIYYNQGPGIQHVAFSTENIVETLKLMKDRGVSLLQIPADYYQLKAAANPKLRTMLKEMQSHNVLIDRDSMGYLYQVFTKPVQSRPTFFLEIIQRDGCTGFGSDNIKHLFMAMEQEQERRESNN
jgi:4-hydroxyphenylpyruvate dioxygenase